LTLSCGGQFGILCKVDLGQNNYQRLCLKEWLDVLKERYLLLDGIAARLGDIKQKENTSVEVCQGSDGLHLNGVSLIERVVKNTRRVNYLPSRVLIIGVSHKKTLCRECIWLHVDIRICHVVDQTGFSYVGVAGEDQGALVCVDAWETAEMFSDLLKVTEGGLKFFDQCTHPTKSCPLQLFAAVKRVCVLQQPNVICSNVVHNIFGLVDVAKSELVMVAVVQNVHQIRVKRMNIVQLREPINNTR